MKSISIDKIGFNKKEVLLLLFIFKECFIDTGYKHFKLIVKVEMLKKYLCKYKKVYENILKKLEAVKILYDMEDILDANKPE